ncbi:MAG: hypothetical protein ACE5DM_01585 [Candidatus Nanoarchaeia archaeon]
MGRIPTTEAEINEAYKKAMQRRAKREMQQPIDYFLIRYEPGLGYILGVCLKKVDKPNFFYVSPDAKEILGAFHGYRGLNVPLHIVPLPSDQSEHEEDLINVGLLLEELLYDSEQYQRVA